ncbi:MAG: MMPL family transporter, partial [Oleispira sp.]|nr:MMPL family transporter [Oleispira sp.]
MVNNTTPRLQWVARFPYWVVLLSTLLMLVTITGAQYLTFTTDFRTYFSSDNPQLKAFEQLEADFNKQDTLIFLVQPENPQSSIYTPTVFSYLQQLTQQSWQIPYARRVDSLINYQRIESRDDELIIDDLVRENIELTPSVIAEIKSYVKQQPRLINNLVSEDGDLSIVVVSLTLPKDDEAATKVLVTHARDMLEKLAVGGIKVELFGTTVINLALAEAVERDMAMLIPLSYLLIFVAIFLLSRSLVGSLLALAMTLLTVATVFGVLGWFGKPLTPVVGAVPSMIMIIVIADCMHILVSFQHYLREGLEKRKAVMKA